MQHKANPFSREALNQLRSTPILQVDEEWGKEQARRGEERRDGFDG